MWNLTNRLQHMWPRFVGGPISKYSVHRKQHPLFRHLLLYSLVYTFHTGSDKEPGGFPKCPSRLECFILFFFTGSTLRLPPYSVFISRTLTIVMPPLSLAFPPHHSSSHHKRSSDYLCSHSFIPSFRWDQIQGRHLPPYHRVTRAHVVPLYNILVTPSEASFVLHQACACFSDST